MPRGGVDHCQAPVPHTMHRQELAGNHVFWFFLRTQALTPISGGWDLTMPWSHGR